MPEEEPIEIEIEEYGPRPLGQRFDIWANGCISGCLVMIVSLFAYVLIASIFFK